MTSEFSSTLLDAIARAQRGELVTYCTDCDTADGHKPTCRMLRSGADIDVTTGGSALDGRAQSSTLPPVATVPGSDDSSTGTDA